jgi:hypothetical protein
MPTLVRGGSDLQFKGHLLLPDETGPGLRVNLDVAEHHLAVESDGGGLGAWPLEAVGVERHGDVFELIVAGEALRFLADDTIAFAYTAVPGIERVSGRRPRTRASFRSFVDRLWNGPEDPQPVSQPPPESDVREAPVDEAADPVSAAETGQMTDSGQPPFDEPGTVDFAVVEQFYLSQSDVEEPVAVEAGTTSCPAIRGDGRRCESTILTESGYCYPHDPKRAFSDKYKAAQEARAQLRRDSTARLNRVYSRLDKAMRQVERGELDPETAMAMAQLARTMCAILEVDEIESGSR